MRDPRDQITYQKIDWHCPCGGCKKARKLAFQEIAQIIDDEGDYMWAMHKIHELLKKELK